MNRNLTYLMPLVITCLAGCLSKPAVTPPIPTPKGTFTGTFKRFHRSLTTSKADTMQANISLKLDSSGNYFVSGDTSTVHAGSFGKFTLGYSDDLIFTDKTLPPTGTPVKQHLNGDYLYSYNGSNFQLLKGVGDTLSYQYNLTKTSN